MTTITSVLIAAFILEAVIQVIKGWVSEDKQTPGWVWQIVGAILGVLLCLLGNVDMLKQAGLPLFVPYVGQVLTGILISRGASFIHDVWDRINNGNIEVSTIMNGVEIVDKIDSDTEK